MFDEALSFDSLSESEIKAQQLRLIQLTIDHAKTHSNFYKKKLRKFKNIGTLEDLHKLPCTSKDELNSSNQDFICVLRNQILKTVNTSGTLGAPTQVALSRNDLNRLAHNEYVALQLADITADNKVQLATSLDATFMATLAYELGLEKIGAQVIKSGTEKPEIQWKSIFDHQIDVLVIVPSFFHKLLLFAKENQLDFSKSHLEKVICIGEPIRNQDYSLTILGQKIQTLFPAINLYSTYASTEMATAFTECNQQNGGHQLRELIYTEVIDENENLVENGEYGELTITTLQNEAFPLIRFKTGDIVKLENSPCPCGRTSPRVSPVLGRKSQQMKLKGTTVYPQAVFDACNSLVEMDTYQLVVFKDELDLDQLIIYLNLSQQKPLSSIEYHFKSCLKVTPLIQLTSYEEMSKKLWKHGGRKPIKFLDLRT